MPANRTDQTLYNPAGMFTTGVATLYKPGELGKRIITAAGPEYQVVLLDSGATASTGAGAVAAGQLAFWKNRAQYLVTNDKPQAYGGGTDKSRNAIAGVFGGSITAGYYCTIQQRGLANVTTDGGGAAVGDQIVAKNAATAVGVLVAAGTAATCVPVGTVRTAESGTTTVVDLNLPVFD